MQTRWGWCGYEIIINMREFWKVTKLLWQICWNVKEMAISFTCIPCDCCLLFSDRRSILITTDVLGQSFSEFHCIGWVERLVEIKIAGLYARFLVSQQGLRTCLSHKLSGELGPETSPVLEVDSASDGASQSDLVTFIGNGKDYKYKDIKELYKFGITHWQQQRRQWHPTPALLPGKSHGWRSLVGRSLWGR